MVIGVDVWFGYFFVAVMMSVKTLRQFPAGQVAQLVHPPGEVPAQEVRYLPAPQVWQATRTTQTDTPHDKTKTRNAQ